MIKKINMKKINFLVIILFALLFLSACELDNEEEPSSIMYGRFVYNGQNLGLRGTGGDGDNMIDVYQLDPQYEASGKIMLYCNQNGEFNSLMYNGHYGLVLRTDRGPWVPPTGDTIFVIVNGKQEVEIEVTPYFTISDDVIVTEDSIVKAKLTINQVVETAKIGDVRIYVSSTSLVDNVAKLTEKAFANVKTPGTYDLEFDLKGNTAISKAAILYARVGVKATDRKDYIFSKTVKIR